MRCLLVLVVGLLTVLLGGVARAQPASSGDLRTITIEPSAVDTYTVRFVGRSLSSFTTKTVELRRTMQADASPSSIWSSQAVSGSNLTFVLAPDTGCGSSGCRAGNIYQVRVQVQDNASNKPTFSFLVRVEWERLRP